MEVKCFISNLADVHSACDWEPHHMYDNCQMILNIQSDTKEIRNSAKPESSPSLTLTLHRLSGILKNFLFTPRASFHDHQPSWSLNYGHQNQDSCIRGKRIRTCGHCYLNR